MDFKFKGTGVAMVTPFDDSGEIDFKSLEGLIDFLINEGVDYILLMGTTSESACLSSSEKNQVIKFATDKINGRVPIMLGLGGNNTENIIETIKNTDFSRVDGILSVAPYYNKPNQEGLYQHFAKISAECPVDIVLYNVPGRTSVAINPETIVKLANDFKNVVAVKEASGSIANMMQIIKDKPQDFHVVSGDDALALPLLSVGGQGVISVAANAFPKELSQMINLGLEGKFKLANTIHYKFLKTIELMFAEGNPTGVKAYMEQLGLLKNNLRLPLVPASDKLYNAIAEDLKYVQ